MRGTDRTQREEPRDDTEKARREIPDGNGADMRTTGTTANTSQKR